VLAVINAEFVMLEMRNPWIAPMLKQLNAVLDRTIVANWPS
jgi:hypothetical protein